MRNISHRVVLLFMRHDVSSCLNAAQVWSLKQFSSVETPFRVHSVQKALRGIHEQGKWRFWIEHERNVSSRPRGHSFALKLWFFTKKMPTEKKLLVVIPGVGVLNHICEDMIIMKCSWNTAASTLTSLEKFFFMFKKTDNFLCLIYESALFYEWSRYVWALEEERKHNAGWW